MGEIVKRKEKRNLLTGIFVPVIAVLILLCFLGGISNLSRGREAEDKQQLEEALRRAAVTCYAVEGIYPPSVEYMVEHYGLQIDSRRFAVSYTAFAENLMPDITVLEK